MSKIIGWVAAALALIVMTAGPMVMGLVATLLGASSSQDQNTCLLRPPISGAWTQPTLDADGQIGSPFGMRFHPILKIWRMHNGVDLGNARGTPIWAVSSGTVTAAVDGCVEGGSCNGGAGNTVAIDHGEGVTTKYLHLLTGSLTVRVGDQVQTGQQIATMGSTGLSTAPHLHFGVQVSGTYVDPDLFMKERGVNVAATTMESGPVAADPLLSTSPESPASTTPDSLTSRTSTGVTVTLSRQQLEEAAVTIGVGRAEGISQRGIQIALMTELQESNLGAHPGIRTPNADQDVANFQQRSLVGWYGPRMSQAENVAWLNNSENAARTFFRGQVVSAEAHAAALRQGVTPAGPVGYQIPGLIHIANWDSLPMGRAAQLVQRSAFPDAYDKWAPVAADILAVVDGVRPNDECGDSSFGKVYPPGEMPQSDRWVGSEERLSPATIFVKRAVAALFPQITLIGGWRASSDIATSDHPHGRAIDVMIADYHDPSQIALGDRVSDFLIANHASLKIKYTIWQQKIWTPPNPTWRPMADRGSDVANHLDHVHVSVAE